MIKADQCTVKWQVAINIETRPEENLKHRRIHFTKIPKWILLQISLKIILFYLTNSCSPYKTCFLLLPLKPELLVWNEDNWFDDNSGQFYSKHFHQIVFKIFSYRDNSHFPLLGCHIADRHKKLRSSRHLKYFINHCSTDSYLTSPCTRVWCWCWCSCLRMLGSSQYLCRQWMREFCCCSPPSSHCADTSCCSSTRNDLNSSLVYPRDLVSLWTVNTWTRSIFHLCTVPGGSWCCDTCQTRGHDTETRSWWPLTPDPDSAWWCRPELQSTHIRETSHNSPHQDMCPQLQQYCIMHHKQTRQVRHSSDWDWYLLGPMTKSRLL